MRTAIRRPFELKGAHVLAAMLMFFGVIISVNIVFATLAIRSYPGEDRQSPYQQGLRYNDEIKAREAQARLGWTITPSLVAAGDGAALVVKALDSNNKALANIEVQGTLRRPMADKFDKPLRFTAFGAGIVRAPLPDLAPGLWEFRGEARDGDNVYAIDERLTWQVSTQP
jgi:nitrogen fixation protein FixH